MRQLTLTGPKTLEWLTVPAPDPQDDGQALVRPLASATCDLDQPMVVGHAPFPTPIALGRECVAESSRSVGACAGRGWVTAWLSRSRPRAARAPRAAAT